jgi:hypothetical protein
MNPRGNIFKLDMDWFFAQTEDLRDSPAISTGRGSPGISTGRGSLIAFTPAAHLLHLIIHLMIQHGEGEIDLLHFYDIHLLIERWSEQINWDDLLKTTCRMNLDYVVYAALQGCKERFDTQVPAAFSQMPTGRRMQPVKNFIEMHRKLILSKHSELYFKSLADLPFNSRVSVLLRFAFPRPEFMRRRYMLKPVWLWPFSYPWRWVVGVGQLLSMLLRQIKNGG